MTKDNLCPVCGKFEFTQEYMDKNEIDINDIFDCPVCGEQISYLVLCRQDENTCSEEYIVTYEATNRRI